MEKQNDLILLFQDGKELKDIYDILMTFLVSKAKFFKKVIDAGTTPRLAEKSCASFK